MADVAPNRTPPNEGVDSAPPDVIDLDKALEIINDGLKAGLLDEDLAGQLAKEAWDQFDPPLGTEERLEQEIADVNEALAQGEISIDEAKDRAAEAVDAFNDAQAEVEAEQNGATDDADVDTDTDVDAEGEYDTGQDTDTGGMQGSFVPADPGDQSEPESSVA